MVDSYSRSTEKFVQLKNQIIVATELSGCMLFQGIWDCKIRLRQDDGAVTRCSFGRKAPS
jgi:hypothetical protein